ncbi:hypothetical protein JCM19240_2965 [Vibrio maritimus]|uniref:Uncharacterized protein n=1 Tax=Vibrio maritimus TaxID=990268 RepID=A0A090TAU3_9VIBR|nr:hypothetical protein JCM19240_2965 [Vibrio maritimus]
MVLHSAFTVNARVLFTMIALAMLQFNVGENVAHFQNLSI